MHKRASTIEARIGDMRVYLDKSSMQLSSKYDVSTFDESILKSVPKRLLPLEPFFYLSKLEKHDLIGLDEKTLREEYVPCYGYFSAYASLLKSGHLRMTKYYPNILDKSKGAPTRRTGLACTIYFPTKKEAEIFLKKRK